MIKFKAFIGRGAQLAFLMVILSGPFAEIMAQPIDEAVLKSVIQISTSRATTGTGFLIATPFERAGNEQRTAVFLVTNKHMLGEWNPIDGDFNHYDWITLHLYRDMPASDGPVEKTQVPLKTADGKLNISRVAVHPDRTVDVAVVRIDDIALAHQNRIRQRMTTKVLTTDWFEPFTNLPGAFAHIGAQVFALGYSNGITSLLTNNPIAKVGHLAATAGEELALAARWSTRSGENSSITIRGKLILVDGLIVPGNSGGPVLLPGGGGVWGKNPKTGETIVQSAGPSKIIGVVSSGWAPAGLSYAYATDYIRSVLDSLLVQMADDSKKPK
jgi:hypothetical protein